MDGPTPDAADPFEVSVGVVREANARGIPLKLLGGQAVRLLCPLFPHRARKDQDMDFACISSKKREVIAFFAEQGFLGDQRFNTLHGDRQMYFTTADGKTSVDVVMDRLNMCHVLDFRDRIDRLPDTLDVADLLLTKLQVLELNREGRARHPPPALRLLGCGRRRAGTLGIGPHGEARAAGLGLVADRHDEPGQGRPLRGGRARRPGPEARVYDPPSRPSPSSRMLRTRCSKPLKWKLRAKVGDRVQWYQLPEEVGH